MRRYILGRILYYIQIFLIAAMLIAALMGLPKPEFVSIIR